MRNTIISLLLLFVATVSRGNAIGAQPNNKLPEWGKTGNGIFIGGKLRTLQRKSTVQKSWCGSRSKLPVPPNTPITVSLFSGDGNNMFTYIGLTTKDVNVESWTAKRPEQYCLYFAGGPRWSGVHDSQFGDRENTSDWRNGIVPTIKSRDKLTIIYEKEKGTIIFRGDKKVVYKGIGFKGDLYLSGSVRYPNERITIEIPIKKTAKNSPPAKPVKELTLREKVVGTYELELKKFGETQRYVLLDNSKVEYYLNGKKEEAEHKWSIVDKEVHIERENRAVSVFSINKDESITGIATIDENGKRKEILKEHQYTRKKIK